VKNMQRELKELKREVKELAEKAKQIKEAKEKLTELDRNLQNKNDLSELGNQNSVEKLLNKILLLDAKEGISVKAMRSLLFLSSGFSITDTANELGVSRQTIYNWLHNKDFQKLLKEYREEAFQASIEQIKEMNYRAVMTLVGLLTRPMKDSEKLKVVKYIIDTNLKLMSEEKLKMEYSKKEKTESKTEELSLRKEQKKRR